MISSEPPAEGACQLLDLVDVLGERLDDGGHVAIRAPTAQKAQLQAWAERARARMSVRPWSARMMTVRVKGCETTGLERNS